MHVDDRLHHFSRFSQQYVSLDDRVPPHPTSTGFICLSDQTITTIPISFRSRLPTDSPAPDPPIVPSLSPFQYLFIHPRIRDTPSSFRTKRTSSKTRSLRRSLLSPPRETVAIQARESPKEKTTIFLPTRRFRRRFSTS
ncbi:hypothetical protein BLNAU_20774 [Blattamonas nauphoetae]|uniref:Uncharacterized protein n=1 Tax=Blattamonas nauphoetae TaxID=2049346 RepID=A0ABQ9WXT0_9EUKA|nr:hypothetical protein BLNAU_20774 [Blattamonas nauphoetae]